MKLQSRPEQAEKELDLRDILDMVNAAIMFEPVVEVEPITRGVMYALKYLRKIIDFDINHNADLHHMKIYVKLNTGRVDADYIHY